MATTASRHLKRADLGRPTLIVDILSTSDKLEEMSAVSQKAGVQLI